MITNLKELLAKADEAGLNDARIAEITGRDRSTVWRWRQKPQPVFIFDEGIMRLVEAVGAER